MKVLMISKACVVGIYQRKLEAIARHEDVSLTVVVPPSWRDERGETLLERAYTDGYDLRVTPIRFNGNFHLHYYPRLGAIMREVRPDVVHIDEEPYNLSTWQALYEARKVGAKTVFFSWQNLNRRYPPPFSLGERWVLNRADYGIMGTADALNVWRAKGWRGDSAVIPQFGTDTDFFAPYERPPERPFTFGYLGRLVPEKGVGVLLDALALLDGDDWCLRIVGGGPDEATLRERVRASGWEDRVMFVKQVPSVEMPAQYHAIDALVLPSLTRANWKEQFGRVLVEAMACGVPVVGSDSGAIPGVIGDGGLVFREGSVSGLSAHLAALMTDGALYRQLAGRGRARVLAHFTHEQIAGATVGIYRTLAKD